MKYLGHFLTLVGAGLAIFGVTQHWYLIEGLDQTRTGLDVLPGLLVAAVAGLAALSTLAAVVIRRRNLVVSEVIPALFIFGFCAWGYFEAHRVLGAKLSSDELNQFMGYTIAIKGGFYYSLGGALVILLGALRVFAAGPAMDPKSRPLRVAVLWNGTIINERIFDEPRKITIGEDIGATFTLPKGQLDIPKRMTLFQGNAVTGNYQLALTREMRGRVSLSDTQMSVQEAITSRTSGVAGINRVGLGVEDWGIIHVGALAIFFQFIQPERRVSKKGLALFDTNMAASSATSALIHVSLVLATLFLWEEDAVIKRPKHVFLEFDVRAEYEEDVEEKEDIPEPEKDEDEGLEDDTTAKAAEGEEGKFGDPDLDPMIESKIPKNDARMVKNIDPKKVGLVDMLSSQKLGGIGAIASIIRADSGGLVNKMAVAMAGSDTGFVLGGGSGGMGFKGTGTGGGGTGGFGRIHGLGKIDTGGGTGRLASLGHKGKKLVSKVQIGAGRSTGFCKRADIAKNVRRRARSIKACYEARLQVKKGLKGKMTVRWTIGMSGRVQSAQVVNSSLGDGGVQGCILRVIRRMSFAKPEGGVCIVQWPFVFAPG